MRNTLLTLALAGVGLCAIPATSRAQDAGNFFINGRIGQTHLNRSAYDLYDTRDTGYAANIGYRWALTPNAAIGIEGGYANLGSFPSNGTLADLPRTARVRGWNLGATGHFNLGDHWFVDARGGFFRPDVRGSFIVLGETPSHGTPIYSLVDVDGSASKWYAGVGVGYDFSPNFGVGLNYDYYNAEVSGLDFKPRLVSVSAEYRF